jgi:hypothetical protein
VEETMLQIMASMNNRKCFYCASDVRKITEPLLPKQIGFLPVFSSVADLKAACGDSVKILEGIAPKKFTF